MWTVLRVVSLAAVYLKDNVWVTVNEARDRGIASSADKLFTLHWHRNEAIDHGPGLEPFMWVKTLAEKPEDLCSDYECWLVKLWRMGYVTEETFALAASIPHAYAKSKSAPAAPAAPETIEGSFLGTVGQRSDIPECQCTEVRSLGVNPEHEEWGERFLIRFVAATGENLVWFASSGGKFDPKAGETYNVRATIAKHEPYQGRASTIIQRPAEYDPATGNLLHPPVRKKREE